MAILVLKPQIEAGIKVFLIDYKDLINESFGIHDFVYVEDEFLSTVLMDN